MNKAATTLQTKQPRFLDLTGAESAYGISRRKIWEWIRAGHLPAYRPGGKLLIDVSELDTFIRSHREKPALDQLVDDVVKEFAG